MARAQHDHPLKFDRFNLDELRTGHTTVNEIEANWKILIENYNECLHCPTVHPELVQVVPAFRKGAVFDKSRADGGVALADGGTSFTANGKSRFEVMPGLDEHDANSLYGCTVYPNMFIDIDARISELGRQPYTTRKFFLKYPDRVMFGTDTTPRAEAYRVYYRFLETDDEYFDCAASHHRQGFWMIYGIFLPKEVLAKVYHENAEKVLYGLK